MSASGSTKPTRMRKPIGIWFAQAYLLFLIALGIPLLEVATWRALLTVAVLVTGIVTLQIPARISFAVSVVVFSLIALLALLTLFEPRTPSAPGETVAYEIGAGVGRFASLGWTLAISAYVALGRSSRSYFGVAAQRSGTES